MPKLIGPPRVKRIPLTRGYYALVDAEDFTKISSVKWQAIVTKLKNGNYVRAVQSTANKSKRYMHHAVLDFYWQKGGPVVDHINRNSLDNRKANLRIVSQKENMSNGIRSLNRVGVCYNKRAKLWFVYKDSKDSPRVNLGYRKTRQEAEALLANANN